MRLKELDSDGETVYVARGHIRTPALLAEILRRLTREVGAKIATEQVEIIRRRDLVEP